MAIRPNADHPGRSGLTRNVRLGVKSPVTSACKDRWMAIVKFGVGNRVRFIGADRALTVRQYDPASQQYLVQRGEDLASREWVSEIYIEACLTPEP